MGGWFFVRGKDAEQTLGDVTAAGATQIALAGADGIFAPGELLLISESDGTETEFLGAVTAVSPTAVDFTLALRASKDSGARLWRATDSISVHADPKAPPVRSVETGVSRERSLGGVEYAIRVAEPATALQWELAGMTSAQEQALIDWIDQATERGLLAFTLVEPARAVRAVRIEDGRYLRSGRRGGRRTLTLNLALIGDGEYR